MNQPKITIITVCLNSVTTIEKTIESVLNQSYPLIEYIIIDGGSKDGTVDIIKKYADKIAFWISEPDNGIYDAMNKGLKIATGDIIGIINSDDWYATEIFQYIILIYKKYGNSYVYHGDIIKQNGSNFRLQKPINDIKKFYQGTILFHPTLFVPHEIYNKIGFFDSTYKIAADYDFMLRCVINNINFFYCNKVIAYMKIGGASSVNIISGFKEVVKSALKHKLNPIKVYYFYLKKIVYHILIKHR